MLASRWASALLLAFGLSLVSSIDALARTARAPAEAAVSARWGNITCTVDRNGNLRVSSYTCIGSSCRGLPRPTTAQCSASSGTSYGWSPATWGTCSATCGATGTQARAVTCRSSAGATVADSLCSGAKPATAQSCASPSCATYAWSTGAWSSCSNTCGGGTQTRAVSCKNGGTAVADSFCSASKPAPSQSCNAQACQATDTTSPSIPAGLAVSKATCKQVDLSWNASQDTGGSGLARYEIYRNNAYLTSVQSPFVGVADASVAASTTYSYEVAAIDNAGNPSGRSVARIATTPSCTVASGETFSLGSVASGGYPYELDVDSNSQLAAVISSGRDLVVVDLATRSTRSLALAGTPYTVSVSGETVLVGEYAASGAVSLRVVDARRGLPTLGILNTVSLPGSFSGEGNLARSGSALYVTGSTAGVVILDASTLNAPRFVGVAWAGESTVRVGAGLGFALAYGARGTQATLDISQPLAPRVVSIVNATIGDMETIGRLALLPSGTLTVWDFTKPTAPVVVGRSQYTGGRVDFELDGGLLVENATYEQLRFFEVNPQAGTFVLLGSKVMPFAVFGWTAAGGGVYVIDDTGSLHVYTSSYFF